ncbi:glycosyl hydrolase family 8 [Iningainema tapete]|uniref:Glycosyl hydrolase n=1 Tax=Iningainema tapete BLCC-T55 TaxID=2748662 RepID=A0A8J7BYY7_9CYAN|nr:glycosyl hydrolase family 8 [Iningainema tapete]MBD2774843.1 glycosyl hydrolase [Iningainema tapete BLCC-T55]
MQRLAKMAVIASLSSLYACYSGYPVVKPKSPDDKKVVGTSLPGGGNENIAVSVEALRDIPNGQLLAESWDSYRRRFIQKDGRVIDYEAGDRSTSEGQAYAMLRAVLVNDPTTFALTLKWGENNLRRIENGKVTDGLWAWKWGKNAEGKWGTIDNNFASDGDIDAITALIFAYRRWNRPEYLELAKVKLVSLWDYSTAIGPQGKRYLLPGPKAAFVPNPSTLYLNPSYLAPYAFRIFAQVDPNRDWLSLVDSSYQILEQSSQLSTVGLPGDWVALDITTGKYQPFPPSNPLQTVYSFDAYRVWWRLSLDAAWFNSLAARRYLQTNTKHLQNMWRERSRIPARLDLQGKGIVDYEATSQYAMLYAAWNIVEPQLAEQVFRQKLLLNYQQGIWDDKTSYYSQNLAWLGLLPPSVVPKQLLQK